MDGYNFTERVRKALSMAREEATRLHHEGRFERAADAIAFLEKLQPPRDGD